VSVSSVGIPNGYCHSVGGYSVSAIEDTILMKCPVCENVSLWKEDHPREFIRNLSSEEVLARALREDPTYVWTCRGCQNARGRDHSPYPK
jgi:hypothetical protein